MREFIDAILAKWQLIKDSCPNESWLPTGVSEDEYLGCGSYGCVFATNDDRVVCKVTTDVSEWEFIKYLTRTKHKYPGIVKYFLAIEIKSTIREDRMFVVWRESAEDIGRHFDGAARIKFSGDSIYSLTRDDKIPRRTAFLLSNSERIISATDQENMSMTELLASEIWHYKYNLLKLKVSSIRTSLLDLLDEGWVLCDVRTKNIGFVTRGNGRTQVVIDPGMSIYFW